jgi:hypothetical protein
VSELGGEVVLHGAVSTALEAAHEMVFRRAPDQRRSPIVI